MFRTDKLSALAIIIAVGIACVAGALILQDGTERYDVTYDLDGGTVDGKLSTSYTPGDIINLPEAIKEGYIFLGWVLSEDDDYFFDGNTTGMTGELKIIAMYEKNVSGYWLRYDVSGEYESGPLDSYILTGTHYFKYMYYDGDNDSYYIHSEYTYTRTYTTTGRTVTYSNEYDYWPSDLVRTLTKEYKETIMTVDGYKECDVQECTNADGSKDTYWSTDDEWFSYKWTSTEIVSTSIFFTKTVITTYTYAESGQDEIPKDCEVTVVAGSGITVTGNQSPYALGARATLTANLSDGTTFGGWYDSGYNLLSRDTTYTFTVSGSMKLYAMNSGAKADVEFESDKEINLDIEGIFDDNVTFTITNTDTYVTITTTEELYTFEDAGPYTIFASTDDGVEKIYNVKVTGYVDREFTWKYDNKTFTITVSIDYDDLLMARSLYTVKERSFSNNVDHNKSFVTYAYEKDFMKPYMDQIVEKMYNAMKEKGVKINDTNVANFILRFTQYIEYQSDSDYMGADEYWKFPLETLYDQGGDCEDTSILFAAIAYVFKETYNLSYEVGFQVIPQHAIGIIKLSGSKYSTNPDGWLYCETTSKYNSATDAGVIPSGMYVTSNQYGTKSVGEYFQGERYYKDRYNTCVIFDIG